MASTRAPELAGREEELAAIAAFLAARDELPGALLLEGEAGIGKTTLFELALAAARGDEDYRVLACTPAGSEQRLAYAGAGDLLTDVLDEVLPALPAP
jgi:MoxR-like ATPase